MDFISNSRLLHKIAWCSFLADLLWTGLRRVQGKSAALSKLKNSKLFPATTESTSLGEFYLCVEHNEITQAISIRVGTNEV
ncbi:hypothetical protein OUZ56_027771 [Daphnia magna]|uniref:Uncharacterized protein n=1 Tax=Daphnia magna TaxID=35525 RepID=A0ABR0B1W3_9CRUS|nr:hypothetical protein OUZ56_027771 [Daphnia magna]